MKLSIIWLIVAWAAPVAQGGPQIDFGDPFHDFGEVERGEKVGHTFEFQNVGSGTLKVERVKASCGCTPMRPARAVFIGPREKGELPLDCTFDVLGDILCLLEVETNGGEGAKLTVKAVVKPKRR